MPRSKVPTSRDRCGPQIVRGLDMLVLSSTHSPIWLLAILSWFRREAYRFSVRLYLLMRSKKAGAVLGRQENSHHLLLFALTLAASCFKPASSCFPEVVCHRISLALRDCEDQSQSLLLITATAGPGIPLPMVASGLSRRGAALCAGWRTEMKTAPAALAVMAIAAVIAAIVVSLNRSVKLACEGQVTRQYPSWAQPNRRRYRSPSTKVQGRSQ